MNNAVIQYGISGSIYSDMYNLYERVKSLKQQFPVTPVIVTITYITEEKSMVMAKGIDNHCAESYDNFKWLLTEAVDLMANKGNKDLGRVIYNSKKGKTK